MRKVGSAETWLRSDTDHRCCRGKGALVVEKGEGERERSIQSYAQGEHFPKSLAGKMRGADFREFLPPVGLEDWNFKGWWAW